MPLSAASGGFGLGSPQEAQEVAIAALRDPTRLARWLNGESARLQSGFLPVQFRPVRPCGIG